MWVRSQDKRLLANYRSFAVTKNWGGKQKAAIIGTTYEHSFWGSTTNSLGLYETMEEAIEELSNIQAALVNNEKLYEML